MCKNHRKKGLNEKCDYVEKHRDSKIKYQEVTEMIGKSTRMDSANIKERRFSATAIERKDILTHLSKYIENFLQY